MNKGETEELARQAKNEYMRDYMRTYRKKNREKMRENKKKWQQKNPDKVRQYQTDYWAKKGRESQEKPSQ